MREVEGESIASNHKEIRHHQPKEGSFRWLSETAVLFFYLTCIAITIVLSIELIFNDKSIKFANDVRSFKQKNASNGGVEPPCDIFRGRWVPDTKGALYTNDTCPGIPPSKNCLLFGRKTDYLNWKWKPDECKLPRFDPHTFFSILRGKMLAFVGDSLGRNQVESLVCILSTVETPYATEQSKLDHHDIIWEFPEHNFTLAMFWSPFLVAATGIPGTSNFDLQLDRLHTNWSSYLPSVDYIVFSASNWFFRENNLYKDGRLIGCTFCNRPDTTAYSPGWAIRMVFRAALRAINACETCKKIVGFVRTYVPQHFENGSWIDGGYCNRTGPTEREEVNMALPDWGYSRMQAEEAEMARIEGKGKGNVFEFLDVTEMMAMRADGHPGQFWDLKGGSDCVHWCLPGPIDTWNALLLERIKRLDSISSHS